MYFDIDYSKLRTALENEAMSCELAINTGMGLHAVTVVMPFKRRILLSYEYLCAAASISEDEAYMLFANGVKDLAMELSEGTFSISDTTLENVKSGKNQSESDILKSLKDPVAREMFMARGRERNNKPQRFGENLNPELRAAFGLRWGLGRVMEKALLAIKNNQDDVERAYVNSQQVRLNFLRGGIEREDFCAARQLEIENIIDVFSMPYDEVNAVISERMEEMERQAREDGNAPI